MIGKSKFLLLSGLPASGKTTVAKEWLAEDPDDRVRINWDEMRLARYGPDWRFNGKQEGEMKAAAYQVAKDALKAGLSVVIDNTNLTEGTRHRWRALGANYGAEIIEQELDVPVDECVRRDGLREGKARVGRAVIERMALFNGFIDWNEYPRLRGPEQKDFLIVDVDGTLSNPEHRRHHIYPAWPTNTECPSHLPVNGKCNSCGYKGPKKDYDAFYAEADKDTPHQPIVDLVGHLAAHYYVLIVSGRPIDLCGKITEDWLLKQGLYPLHLFMRNGGDYRADYIIKGEMLDLLPKERIAYVLDDRDQVVKMWRANGLTCLQVAEGSF